MQKSKKIAPTSNFPQHTTKKQNANHKNRGVRSSQLGNCFNFAYFLQLIFTLFKSLINEFKTLSGTPVKYLIPKLVKIDMNFFEFIIR